MSSLVHSLFALLPSRPLPPGTFLGLLCLHACAASSSCRGESPQSAAVFFDAPAAPSCSLTHGNGASKHAPFKRRHLNLHELSPTRSETEGESCQLLWECIPSPEQRLPLRLSQAKWPNSQVWKFSLSSVWRMASCLLAG